MAYFAVFSQGTHMHVNINDRCIDLFATVAQGSVSPCNAEIIPKKIHDSVMF